MRGAWRLRAATASLAWLAVPEGVEPTAASLARAAGSWRTCHDGQVQCSAVPIANRQTGQTVRPPCGQ
jgi:hypothetical protein